mgnify:FL=1
MKKYSGFYFIGLALLFGCKNYSDQKIQVREQEFIELFSPSIDICIIGKEEVNYAVKLSCDNILIDSFSIKSTLDKSFKKIKFEFTNLKDDLPLLTYKLITTSQIKLELVAINKENKISIDTTMSFKIKLPPISTVSSVEGTNFSSTSLVKAKEFEQKIRGNISTGLEKNIKRAAILTEMITTRKFHPTVEIDDFSMPVLKTIDKIKIKILTDTVYPFSVIGRYPSKGNKVYGDVNLDKIILETLIKDPDKIKTDWHGKKEGNLFVLEDEIEAKYDGLGGIFLINIEKDGSYSYNEVGNFLVDETAPNFNNHQWGSFNGDARYEGLLCLTTEDFYGYNPFTIPFLGKVFGDIKEIYVDGKKIPFRIGEDLYFKKAVYLDGGYNRIPIKIIDSKGNSAEYFIPVTIESMHKNEINIDNDINIENN